MLLEGSGLAVETGDMGMASTAQRELGYIAVLRGQYQRSLRWLDQARELAGDHPGHRAWIELIAGKAIRTLAGTLSLEHLDEASSPRGGRA